MDPYHAITAPLAEAAGTNRGVATIVPSPAAAAAPAPRLTISKAASSARMQPETPRLGDSCGRGV